MQSYWSSEYHKLDQHMKCNSTVDLPEKNGNSENDVPYSETNGFSNQDFVTVEPELRPVPLAETGLELTHGSHDAVQKEEAQSIKMISNTDSAEINADAECEAQVFLENNLCDICGEWFSSNASFHCERLENSVFQRDPPLMVEPVLSRIRDFYRRKEEEVSDTNPSTQKLCPYCNVVFEYDDLSNHISEHSSLPYFCDRCGIFFSCEEELHEHEKKHGDTVLCLNCFKVCDDAVDLITHTTVRALPLECVLCKNMFLSHCAMHSHKATCSPKKKISNNVSNQKVKCSQCPMTFASQQRLEDHFRQHTGERPFFCEYCQQTYSRKDNLNRHLRRNRIEDGLTCECKICLQEFPSTCSLKKHYANEHPERTADQYVKVACNTEPSETNTVNGRSLRSRIPSNEPNSELFSPQTSVIEVAGSDSSNETEVARFSCDLCSKTFSFRKSLTKHVRSVHSQDDLPHACHLCSRTFSELILLNRHLNWHKGAQYQCRECGICYSHSKHLQRHLKKVHSGKKDTSNESSSKMTSFSDVIKSETETSSSVMESKIIPSMENTKVSLSATSNEMASTSFETKNFLTYAELSVLIENAPKPYICQVCGKLTDSKRNYLEHYLSHSKERPFKCDVCGQGFIRERRMQDHRVVHERPLKKPKLELEENTHFNSSSNGEKFSNNEKIHLRTRVHVTPPPLEKSLRPRPHDSTYLAKYPHLSFKTPSISLNRFDLYPPTSEGLVQSSSSMVHFRCDECNRVFSRRSALVSHQRACSDNSPPSNEIPRSRRSKPFKYLMSFEKEDKIVVYGMEHDIFMVNGQQHYTCGICGRSFDKKNFIFKHTLIHVKDKPFKCALCLKRGFMTRNSLKKHFRKCHKGLTIDKDGNVIQKDGTAVTDLDLWKEPPPPEKNVKKSLLADRLTQGYVENDISRSPEQITVECDLSDMMHMFDSDMMVDKEEKVETQNFQITAPVTAFSQPHYPVHTIFFTQPVEVRQFTNDVDMSYVDNYSHYQLNDVTMNHFLESTDIEMEDPLLAFKPTNPSQAAEELFLTCGQCNTSFETKEEIFKHYVAHDMANDPIKCATCDKEFVRRQYLQMHAMMHVRPKRFQCTFCPKSFRAKRDMDDHIRTHTGEKPFACEYCDRKFRVRKQLYAHRKLHVQAFQCAKCSASFSMEWSLKRHEKLCLQGNSDAVSADDGVIIKDVQENLIAMSVDNGVLMKDAPKKVTADDVVMIDAIKQEIPYHEPGLHDEAVADVNVTEKGIETLKCTEDSNVCQIAT